MIKLLTLWMLDDEYQSKEVSTHIISHGIWETVGVEERLSEKKEKIRIYQLCCIQSYHKKLKIGDIVYMAEDLIRELCHEVKLIHLPKTPRNKPEIKLSKTFSIEEKTKMFLFSRWMAVCYDSNIMNTETGHWWKERLNEFERTVLPNLIKNNSYVDTFEFLSAAPNKALDFFEYEEVPGLQSGKTIKRKKDKT